MAWIRKQSRLTRGAGGLVAGALAAALSAGAAQAAGCEEAWYQRNLVYKEAGYCFKTARAIRAFGNAGCRYDAIEDVPLSAFQRRVVADMQREERRMGCPR